MCQPSRLLSSADPTWGEGSFRDGDTTEIAFTGAPVTALDWCPSTGAWMAGETSHVGVDSLSILLARSGKRYLAVSTLANPSEPVKIGLRSPNNSPASIQIWSLSPSNQLNGRIYSKVFCESILCMEEGSPLQLKWCPLPSHDTVCVSYLYNWVG